MFDPLKHKARVAVYTGVAFLFGVGIASGLGWTDASLAMPTLSDEPQLSEDAVRPARDLSEAFVAIAETVTPAVVRIETLRPARERQIPSPFRRFFGPEEEGRPDGEPRLEPVGGSGFLVSDDGFILTNDHVVQGAREIRVHLPDRRSFEAEVVGTDPFTDVAVIRIQGEGLPHLSFGDSDRVRVGEWVVAVGNPGLGGASQLDYTVTAGIVSAKGRPLQLLNQELLQDPETQEIANYAIEDFIQTDAVINPGNSGGPMVDLQGRVVGINSAIASRTGFYQGYGFAIPVNLARRVMEDLIQYGRVRRALLGVGIEDLTEVDAEFYGLPDIAGVLVTEVRPGEAADRAGLRSQDVIVAVDGRRVERANELQQVIASYRPGDRVTVTIYRDGERREIAIRLGEAQLSAEPQPEPVRAEGTEERLGIQVDDLTPELARRIRFEDPGGAVITGVEPFSPAQRQGLAPGLRILQINGEDVESAGDVRERLAEIESGRIVNIVAENRLGTTRVFNIRVP